MAGMIGARGDRLDGTAGADEVRGLGDELLVGLGDGDDILGGLGDDEWLEADGRGGDSRSVALEDILPPLITMPLGGT